VDIELSVELRHHSFRQINVKGPAVDSGPPDRPGPYYSSIVKRALFWGSDAVIDGPGLNVIEMATAESEKQDISQGKASPGFWSVSVLAQNSL
jgi:hypothetical protein